MVGLTGTGARNTHTVRDRAVSVQGTQVTEQGCEHLHCRGRSVTPGQLEHSYTTCKMSKICLKIIFVVDIFTILWTFN